MTAEETAYNDDNGTPLVVRKSNGDAVRPPVFHCLAFIAFILFRSETSNLCWCAEAHSITNHCILVNILNKRTNATKWLVRLNLATKNEMKVVSGSSSKAWWATLLSLSEHAHRSTSRFAFYRHSISLQLTWDPLPSPSAAHQNLAVAS